MWLEIYVPSSTHIVKGLCFQNSHLEVICKCFLLSFSSVGVFQVFKKRRFLSDLCCLAAEFCYMLLDATMCIFAGLSKVASSIIIAIVMSWESSPQAQKTGYSVADSIPPAVYLVLWVFAWKALGIAAQVPIKGVSVNQSLLERSASRLDDLDRPAFPPSDSRLLLLLLHHLLQFRSWRWWNKDAGLPEFSKPALLFLLLGQPAGRFLPIFRSVDWPPPLLFCSYDLTVALKPRSQHLCPELFTITRILKKLHVVVQVPASDFTTQFLAAV